MLLKNVRVFYINLDTRPDRMTKTESELQSIGVHSATRFPAIMTTNGAIGCSLSHLKILEMARSNKWEHVMIVEDDIHFLKPQLFRTQLDAFLSSNTPFDVVLMAGNNVGPCVPNGDHSVRITKCQTTTGYIVCRHYYDRLIDNFRTGVNSLMRAPESHSLFAIDKFWHSLQKLDRWFLIIPLTVTQRQGYSNIEKKDVNYDPLMLQLTKPSLVPATLKPRNKGLVVPRRFAMSIYGKKSEKNVS